MNQLIADSGSTKTHWLLKEDEKLPKLSEKWKGDVKKLSWSVFDEAQNIYCSTSDELCRAETARKWLNIGMAKLMKGR